jgi:hypothetical protein
VENPYIVENYLVTSEAGFSPFEQYLGPPPFRDLRGEGLWPVLAYTEDGGIHPGKVSLLFCGSNVRRVAILRIPFACRWVEENITFRHTFDIHSSESTMI